MNQKSVCLGLPVVKTAESRSSIGRDRPARTWVEAFCRRVAGYVRENYYILALVTLLILSIMLVLALEK